MALDASELQLDVVSDRVSFLAMADEWSALAAASSACFFMSWDWHYTWWDVYSKSGDRLYIVRVLKNGDLVGLLPMYARRRGLSWWPTLMFIGTGEPSHDEVASEYLDVIGSPDCLEEVAASALEWIASCQGWGNVELRCMLEDAALVKAYRGRQDLNIEEHEVGHRYRVDLKHTEAKHLELFSKKRLKRIDRSRRALERDGGLTQVSVEGIEQLDQAFKQLTELNHERQDKKQRKSVFASEKFRTFHRKLIELIHDSGAGNIHQFKLGSKLLAVLYCFYDDQTCYYYQSGFSQRDGNRYMPLTFAHFYEIARNRGLSRQYYDLMRAESPSYKEEFGCEMTAMVSTFIFCSDSQLRRFRVLRDVRRKLVSTLAALGITRR